MLKQFIAFIDEQGWNLDSTQIAEILWFTQQVSLLNPEANNGEQEVKSSNSEVLKEDISKLVSILAFLMLVISGLEGLALQFLDNYLNKGKKADENFFPPSLSSPLTIPSSNQSPSQNQQTSLSTEAEKLPIKLPDTGIFRNTLALARLTKPLKQKVNSRVNQELNIKKTIKYSAELSTPKFPLYFPVLTPKKERWLDVALLLEDSESMVLWQSLSREVKNFLEHLGAFRDIKPYRINWNNTSQSLQISALNNPDNNLSPNQLNSSDGRRLILIVSDCISEAWRSTQFKNILKEWSTKGLLTLLHPFPERMWERTRLDYSIRVSLENQKQGTVSQKWQGTPLESWQAKNINKQTLTQLPVISLEPESMGAWVNVVMGKGTSCCSGVWLNSDVMYAENKDDDEDDDEKILTPLLQINNFYATSSDYAWQLIQWLSAIPVNLATIRLVQRTLLPESTQVNVAEVTMGGLLKPAQPIYYYQSPHQVQFEFLPGIREEFLERLGNQKFRLGVMGHLTEKIASHFGYQTVREFEATLLTNSLELRGDDNLELIQAFATISVSTLRQYGEKYETYIKKIESYLPPIPELEGSFEFEVEVATVEFEETSENEQTLQQWSFETPTVNRRGEIIKTTTYTASYFTKTLTNGVELEMVAIPGGTFTMGSPESEKGSFDRERPQHNVTLQPFFMGKYPVTQAQWKAIASRTDLKVERDLDLDPSRFKEDPPQRPLKSRGEEAKTRWDRPVENVNWYDAVEFCQRLSQLTGREYTLPSEAQWEYACRGVTEPLNLENGESYPPFYFGETITADLANYNASRTYADEPEGERSKETTPVGQFPPNPFGLYDMHGNVWEWCLDDWHENYENAPTDGSAWIDSNQQENVNAENQPNSAENDENQPNSPLRGGSWFYVPTFCRSAIRNSSYRRDNRNNINGFRVVCVAGRTL